MVISTTDIVAYLGAAAWLPQLLTWSYNLLKKPSVTIKSAKSVEIGYTGLGPIFNLNLSLNVNKKDTLIDFLGVIIKHEDGSEYEFEWAGSTEIVSQITSIHGENQTIQRNNTPIQIKLSTLSLTEKLFRFRESEFVISQQLELAKLIEHLVYTKRKATTDHEELMNSKEVDDYLKFIRAGFMWKAGTYEVTFVVRSPEKINFNHDQLNFHLDQDNIDLLMKNIEQVILYISSFIGNQPDNSSWLWVYPWLKKISS